MRRHVRELVVALKFKPLLCASPPPISLSSSNSLSFLRRPPSSCATMINENNNIKNDNSQELETIFKQKKLVRSRVRKALKAMEPSLRFHEGNPNITPLMQANEPVDLFLLPGLAFDRTGRRLDRGGGYDYGSFYSLYFS